MGSERVRVLIPNQYRIRKRSRVVWEKRENGAKHREKNTPRLRDTRQVTWPWTRRRSLSGRAGTTVSLAQITRFDSDHTQYVAV